MLILIISELKGLVFCCSGYNHPQNVFPAPKFGDSIESFTWWLHTPGFTLWACVSLHTHLACSFHKRFCMFMSMSFLRPCFGHAQGLHFVCTCYVRYEIMCHTHTRSPIHYCASVVMVDQWSITSFMLVTYTVSHSCWTCVSGWFESSRHQVMRVGVVRSHLHLSLVHTLSHLLKFWRSDSPLTAKLSPSHPLDRLSPKKHRSTKQVFPSCTSRKQSNQLSCSPPKESNPTATLGMTPLKNCAEASNLGYSTN